VALIPRRPELVTVAGSHVDLWDESDGHHVGRLTAGTSILSAVPTSDGKLLLAGDADGRLHVWDLATRQAQVIGKGGAAITRVALGHQSARGRRTSARSRRSGDLVLIARSNGRVEIWRLPPARPFTTFHARSRLVTTLRTPGRLVAAAFSPDAGLALTATNEDTCVWNTQTGELLYVLSAGWRYRSGASGGHRPVCASVFSEDDQVYHTVSVPRLRVAAFSPDGSRIVTGDDSGQARVWAVRAGRGALLRPGHQFDGSVLDELSPAQRTLWKRLSKAQREKKKAQTFGPLVTHSMSGGVTSIAFTGNGTRVATGAADGSVHVWDLSESTAHFVVASRAHSDQVTSVAFSPNGRWIVTASDDGTAAVWNANTGTREVVFLGHTGPVERALFTTCTCSGGSRIVTTRNDGTVRLWRLPQESPNHVFTHGGDVHEVRLSDHGALVVVSQYGGAAVFDARTGRRMRGLGSNWPYAAVSPDGSRLLAVSPNDVGTGTLDPKAKSGRLSASRLHVRAWPVSSADGRSVVLLTAREGSRSSRPVTELRVWDTRRKKPGPPFGAKQLGELGNVDVSDDGSHALVWPSTGIASVWDLHAQKRIQMFTRAASSSAELSPDGSAVAGVLPLHGTRRLSGTRVWSARTGKQLFMLPTRGTASLVRFSPRGKLIVTAGNRNAAEVWNAANGKPVASRVATLVGHTGPIVDAAFSPNGEFVATASDDGSARVWVAWTGVLVDEFRVGGGRVERVAFDPTGTRVLVTGSHASAIFTCIVCVAPDQLVKLVGRKRPNGGPSIQLPWIQLPSGRRTTYSAGG
jgi:WD40 repeat protein